MNFFKKRKRTTLILLLSLAVIVSAFVYLNNTGNVDHNMMVEIKRGPFEITVFTTGELEAKSSVKILGPSGMRALGIWQVKISDIVPEGTVVKKGDYVAALDKSEIAAKIKDAENELIKFQSQFTQVQIDTTLTLRQARDELVNLAFALKEKEIIVEQSAYEPPATIRQTKLDLEKSERAHDQAQKNYKIKVNQAKAKMSEVAANLSIVENKLSQLKEVIETFNVTAPATGMVIYDREWNGQRKTAGSTLSAWDLTVATLPDLSLMISKTYVNEVDIRKIKVGQYVDVTLDAFPEKKLTGKIITVANMGEQKPKSDAKVFEVNIEIHENDTTLRPSMTTGNKIQIGKLDRVLSIPLESVHNDGDSLSYVFIKKGIGIVKKEIKLAETNEDFAVVKYGLQEGEKVFLSTPEDSKDVELEKLKITAKPKK